MAWPHSKNLDVGDDSGTPVDFKLTAKLDKLTIAIDRPKLTPEDEKRLRATAKSAADRR